MATIFSVRNSDGCVGRCDAKCHEATGFDCKCICGGAFHGVGSEIAWEDRKLLIDDEILEGAAKLLKGRPGRVAREPEQLELFEPAATQAVNS